MKQNDVFHILFSMHCSIAFAAEMNALLCHIIAFWSPSRAKLRCITMVQLAQGQSYLCLALSLELCLLFKHDLLIDLKRAQRFSFIVKVERKKGKVTLAPLLGSLPCFLAASVGRALAFSSSACCSRFSSVFSAFALLLRDRESLASVFTCDSSLPSSKRGPVCSSAFVGW
jgi:hypothetical protein